MTVRAIVLVALLASSCLSGDWTRVRFQRQVTADVLASLPKRGLELQECLDRLGAPTLVFEHRVHGLVLAYVWEQRSEFGGSASVPVTADGDSVSFSYTHANQRSRALALWFDDAWRLTDWREGPISSLLGEAPPRPATLEEIELSR